MYDILKTYLKKPELYEKTPEKFWNDEHISKGMLKAHLDPNTDAASRKPEFIDRAVKWISLLLPVGASLLDIGCGPGLYTKRFSEHGLNVTGLDFSERSINYAKAHDPKTEYVLQSYLEMDYENRFDLITLIWCDYGALVPADRDNLLERVYKALKPGGLFLFDVFTREQYIRQKDKTSWEVCENGGFWSPNSHICLNAEYRYGDDINLYRYVIIEREKVRCFNIWDTCFTKDSLTAELAPFGFSEAGFFADVTGTPYTDGSKTLCTVIRKQTA